jgi:UDP-glucose 4-epimerase
MTSGVAVVTGATGFLGAPIARALSADFDVVPLSFSLGTDLAQPGWVEALPERAELLVWTAQSRQYRQVPEGFTDGFAVNQRALFESLEWARTAGVRRVVYLSTGGVYAPQAHALKESDPCLTTSFYFASKYAAELMLEQYAPYFRVVVARLFSPYGPGQKDKMIPAVLARLRDKKMLNFAPEGPWFTPIYFEDCVRILRTLCEMELPENPLVVNVGGPERIAFRQLAERLATLACLELRSQSGDTSASWCADISKLRSLVPDFHFTPLETGLEEVVRGA